MEQGGAACRLERAVAGRPRVGGEPAPERSEQWSHLLFIGRMRREDETRL
jgi:hypothetical protein